MVGTMKLPDIYLKAECILNNGIRTGFEYDPINNKLIVSASMDMRKNLVLNHDGIKHPIKLVNSRKGLIPLLRKNRFNVHNNRIEAKDENSK